jgi:hypothetical protein
MSRVSDIRRDPVKVKNLLRFIARNTASLADAATFAGNTNEKESSDISRPIIYDYLDSLMLTSKGLLCPSYPILLLEQTSNTRNDGINVISIAN